MTAQNGLADFGTDTNAPEISPPPAGGADDALTRMARQRELEQQQLGAGR